MKRIFIIDNSNLMRRLLRADLESAGFSVEEAANGKEACDRLKALANPPDLIIMDVHLHVMDGLSMLENLNQDERYKTVLKFILTTETGLEARSRAKMLGVTAWIAKPYEKDSLLIVVNEIINAD